jgi:nicotinate phosphoribosyltransferase
LLDDLGAASTQIVISGDLTAESIAELVAAAAPIDAIGVGTSVVTGDGYPTASLAYKLVAIEDDAKLMRPVAKTSPGKLSLGGRKTAYRIGADDVITLADDDMHPSHTSGRLLTVEYVRSGVALRQSNIVDAARRLAQSRVELGGATLTGLLDIRDPS